MLKRWQFWLGIGISLFFIYVALANLNLGQVWDTIKTAEYAWLLPAVGLYFVAVGVRTVRWQYMLRGIKGAPISRLFPVVVIGYMGNNLYPARAGELIRAYVLRKREGVPMSASLATILVERVFDSAALLFLAFALLPAVPLDPEVRGAIVLASLVFLCLLVAFVLLATMPQRTRAAYEWLIRHIVPPPLREPVLSFADRFLDGLRAVRQPKDVAVIFVSSLLVWLVMAAMYWFIMHCFSFRVPLAVLVLLAAVSNLATAIPSSPGHVGTFDAPGIAVLGSVGVPGSAAASYVLVLHAALWFPVTLLGLCYMWRLSVTWRELATARGSTETGRETSAERT